MNWKFELTYNSTTIEAREPIGWDDVDFSLKRDFKSYGMSFEFSSELNFYGVARKFIIDAYDAEGIDARIDIKISERQSANYPYTIFYEGVLKLNDIEIDAVFAKVRIEQSGFNREFRGKRDLDVSLTPNKTVRMHSKTIRKQVDWKVLPDFDSFTSDFGLIAEGQSKNLYYFPLLFINNEELEGGSNPIPLYYYESSPPPFFASNEVAQTNVNFSIKVVIKSITDFTTAFVNCKLQYLISDTFDANAFTVLQSSGSQTLDNEEEFTLEGAYTGNHNFNEDTRVWILVYFETLVYDGDEDALQFTFDSSSFIDIYQDTSGSPSQTKGIMLFDAFNQITENYTGLANRFESNLLEVGCGNNILLTNGFQLRGIDKPIVVNFDELFEGLRAIFNLGVVVQKESGLEVVRVDSFETFFSDFEIIDIYEPNDLQRKPFSDLLFNLIKIGYDKWQDTALGQINGLDEFNSKRQYATKLKLGEFKNEEKTRKELDLTCKNLITSGYLIEFMRRKSGQNTTDSSFDNDLFLICLNQMPVASDLYEDGVSATYSIGTVSERNEAFTHVENVIDPNTVYNLRLSPVRNLHRWKSYISAQSVKGNANLGEIQFRSGEGNFLMRTEIDDVCERGGFVVENEDISIIIPDDAFPILEAEELSFTYPLRFLYFYSILSNNKGYFKININGKVLKGYLLEMRFKPNKGIANFKIIKKYDN